MEEWGQFADRCARRSRNFRPQDTVYQCGGGISSFAIDPYGGMSICVLSEATSTTSGAGTFRGLGTVPAAAALRKVTRPTNASSCTLKAVCGMCPANGELEHGDAKHRSITCATSPTCGRTRSIAGRASRRL